MKREIWINKANSFDEAQKFDTAYYLNLSSAERVETVQIIEAFNGGQCPPYENTAGIN